MSPVFIYENTPTPNCCNTSDLRNTVFCSESFLNNRSLRARVMTDRYAMPIGSQQQMFLEDRAGNEDINSKQEGKLEFRGVLMLFLQITLITAR